MTKIVAINGSPKQSSGVSELIIKELAEYSNNTIESHRAIDLITNEQPALPSSIMEADILLVVFPLYVDSLPAPLIKALQRIEKAKLTVSNNPMVFAVSNCGFFEATQTKLALKMIRAFAHKVGFSYGYGLGIGAGPMLAVTNKGPTANITVALKNLARELSQGDHRERPDVFLSPKIPPYLYKLAAHSGWYRSARKSSQRKQLAAKPHES